jgi:hypothetical protein
MCKCNATIDIKQFINGRYFLLEFITKIMKLADDVQEVIMHAIQEVYCAASSHYVLKNEQKN